MKFAILLILTAASSFAQQKPWRQMVEDRLPYYGEHNWIVVAESAFPLRSDPGFETIFSNDSQANTVKQLMDLLLKNPHLRPIVHANSELNHVAEQDAPGIGVYREFLADLMEKLFPDPQPRPTQQGRIMGTVDQAAKTYNVLIIKTNSALPYSSVFLELMSGYWPDDAEHRLREAIH